MAWFVAHIVFVMKYKNGRQRKFSFYENAILLRCKDRATAWNKAKTYGLNNQGDAKGTLMWNSRPSEQVFSGVRKIVSVLDSRLASGTELTYSRFSVDTAEKVQQFVEGLRVGITYEE